MRRTPALAVAAVALAATIAGCGSTQAPKPKGPGPAAEPARSPQLTTTPAGTVVKNIGAAPEGLVADTKDDLVVAAIRGRKLALLPAATPNRFRTVDVPGTARHLRLAGPDGPLLVPGEDTDTLAEVALPSGKVLSTVTVGRQPHDATATGVDGRIAVADELGGAVSFVADGKEIARVRGPVQPGGLASAGNGRIGVVDVRGNTLDVYDVATTKLVTRLAAGDGPTHAVELRAGLIAVADTRGSAVYVFDLTGTPRQVSRLPLPGTPYGLAADGNDLWATLTARNEIVKLTVGTGGGLVRTDTIYPTVQQPNSAAVDGARRTLYVAGATATGTLEIIPLS